jgi:hypothetical protein
MCSWMWFRCWPPFLSTSWPNKSVPAGPIGTRFGNDVCYIEPGSLKHLLGHFYIGTLSLCSVLCDINPFFSICPPFCIALSLVFMDFYITYQVLHALDWVDLECGLLNAKLSNPLPKMTWRVFVQLNPLTQWNSVLGIGSIIIDIQK